MEEWLATWHRLSDVAWYKEEDRGFRHRFAVPASRLPATMEAWGLTAAEFAAVPVVAEAVRALQFAAERPGQAREIMEREDLAILDLDDPMQKLAFTLYSMLVSASAVACSALAALGVVDAAGVHFEPASGTMEAESVEIAELLGDEARRRIACGERVGKSAATEQRMRQFEIDDRTDHAALREEGLSGQE